MTNDRVTGDGVTSDGVTNDRVTSDGMTNDGVMSDDMTHVEERHALLNHKKTEIMSPPETIPQIATFLLRIADEVSSAGLYNGKAGLSLSLFIASRYLQDERLEDKAYDLLQEALITKTHDISFENGLAGIGYALLYLIEHKYIAADFDDVFGEQYEAILKSNLDKNPAKLLTSLQVIHFLTKVRNFKKNDSRINALIKAIFEGIELFLTIQFHDFTDIHYINRKEDVLKIYDAYLKLVDYAGYAHFSRVVLADYVALHRKGRIVGSLETGYYLNKIVCKYTIAGYDDVIQKHIGNNEDEKSNSRKCQRASPVIASLQSNPEILNIKILRNYVNDNDKTWTMQDMQTLVNEKPEFLGYGAGLARFLIYCIDNTVGLL